MHRCSAKISLIFTALASSSLLIGGCSRVSLSEAFDHNTTPNYAEERKGIIPGAITGGIARIFGGHTSPTNIHWAELLGAYAGAQIKSNPEVMVTELQNKGVNAFFLGETLVVALHTDDYFYPGSNEVMPEAEGKLQMVGNLLARYSDQPILAEGFNDDSYDLIDNIDRAESRASAVAAFLWAHGVPPARFHIISHGDGDQTIAELVTASGLADNRQVVLCTKADRSSFALDLPLG